MAAQDQRAIRVAIVDDDPDTRLLVRLATDLDERYELVGEYETIHAAVGGLIDHDVDVVIVDRVGDGDRAFEMLAQLRVAVGRARVVVINHEGTPLPADLALAAGADAFLDRTAFGRVTDALQLAASHLESAA